VPANRSRTQEWRRCLKQVHERKGALEIAIAGRDGSDAGPPAPQLVWRVRILSLNENEIVVEQPTALGQAMRIDAGIELVVVLSIGQNRWMFTTRHLGATTLGMSERKPVTAMRLAMPESVQRCQRRNYYRIETASLNLPQVEIWPLLDPKSVLVAERACAIQAEMASGGAAVGSCDHALDEDMVMPEVGPKFTATLVNLGGGGVGLRVSERDSQTLLRHKLFWIRIVLPSATPLSTPICATIKLAHTHMESTHDTYAGMAFDFSFNPAHQRFVVDQICRYITLQQRAQNTQRLSEDQRRLSA
jgi:c-di-GMP-binding flagellar brake protein YcgR